MANIKFNLASHFLLIGYNMKNKITNGDSPNHLFIAESHTSFYFLNVKKVSEVIGSVNAIVNSKDIISVNALSREMHDGLHQSYEEVVKDSSLLNLLSYYRHTIIENYRDNVLPLKLKTSEGELLRGASLKAVEFESYSSKWAFTYLRYKCSEYYSNSWFINYDFHPSMPLYECFNVTRKDELLHPFRLPPPFRNIFPYSSILSNHDLLFLLQSIEKCGHKHQLAKQDSVLISYLKEALDTSKIITFYSNE